MIKTKIASFKELAMVAASIVPTTPAREFSFLAVLMPNSIKAGSPAKLVRATAKIVNGAVDIIPASRY